jgi:hypothetical protein
MTRIRKQQQQHQKSVCPSSSSRVLLVIPGSLRDSLSRFAVAANISRTSFHPIRSFGPMLSMEDWPRSSDQLTLDVFQIDSDQSWTTEVACCQFCWRVPLLRHLAVLNSELTYKDLQFLATQLHIDARRAMQLHGRQEKSKMGRLTSQKSIWLSIAAECPAKCEARRKWKCAKQREQHKHKTETKRIQKGENEAAQIT